MPVARQSYQTSKGLFPSRRDQTGAYYPALEPKQNNVKKKYYAIVVWERGVMSPRCYKCSACSRPNVTQLISWGANINQRRRDNVHVERISKALYDALAEFGWIRP
jgi:hypothetical protein